MRLAIIVPYRDRRYEMDIFIPHMEEFLTNKQIDYKIFIAEQSDDRPFNYGKLCNATFNEIKDEYDYFCFHDIDLLPINDTADYSYKETPTQIVFEDNNEKKILPYDEYFGGVVLFTKEDFIKVNGYGNDYWGKGYVDLDLLFRCVKKGLVSNRKYNYSNDETLQLDLKDRQITKKVTRYLLDSNAMFRTNNSKVLSGDFTLSFHYKQKQLKEDKLTLFRTDNGFDFQIFSCKNEIIIQFFDMKREMFQFEVRGIDLLKLNHYTIIHNVTNKEFIIYVNNLEHMKINYSINYEYPIKDVILGDRINTGNVEFFNFKLFTRVLNEQEVLRNYYYGIESDCLEFNNICSYNEQYTLIDKQMNRWVFFGNYEFSENETIKRNKPRHIPNRIKGQYKSIGHKFEDIEDTFDPDILENRRTYLNDLLTNKINIDKFGLKSVKYTLLNRTEFNENTEWLKMSI